MTNKALGRGSVRRVGKGKSARYQARWSDYGDDGSLRDRRRLFYSRDIAQEYLELEVDKRDRRIAGLPFSHLSDISLGELVDVYEAELKSRGARLRTLQELRASLLSLQAVLGISHVSQLSPQGVLTYRTVRLRSGVAPKTINNAVGHINAALEYGVRLEILSRNPISAVRRLNATRKSQVRTCRALSDDECRRLLAVARRRDYEAGTQGPLAPVYQFLVETGVRYGEMRRLLVTDLADNTVIVRPEIAGKGGKGRRIPINLSLRRLLDDYWTMVGHYSRVKSNILFRNRHWLPWSDQSNNLLRALNKCLKGAGIPKKSEEGTVSIHALRHTFATRCAYHGMPFQKVQALTGHQTAATLLDIYTHLEGESAREDIEALPRLNMKE